MCSPILSSYTIYKIRRRPPTMGTHYGDHPSRTMSTVANRDDGGEGSGSSIVEVVKPPTKRSRKDEPVKLPLGWPRKKKGKRGGAPEPERAAPKNYYTGENDVRCLRSTPTELKLSIKGKAWAKARPRRSGYGHFYNPNEKQERDLKIASAIVCHSINGEIVKHFEPGIYISMEATFVFKSEGLMRTKDVDNLLKFLLDALQDVVYHDDKMIVRATGSKMVGRDERTVVRFVSVEPEMVFEQEVDDEE